MAENNRTIKVPGKLMIAGEFSVLVPHQHLVVTAVDRFVYAQMSEANENKISLEDFHLHNVSWEFTNGKVQIETEDPRVSFVHAAMEVSFTYLEEKGVALAPFHLSIRSELDDQSGVKYGLGSSAAVVSAVVSAIMFRFAKTNLSKELLFKLAALAHVKVQGSGSGADIAASIYGGMLAYASFQAEWLLEEYKRTETLRELIEKDWKYLSIRRVTLPDNIRFCVGWTGKPASTVKLVDEILTLQQTNEAAFDLFLEKSEVAVQEILAGLEDKDHTRLFHGVKANRKALRNVGEAANVPVETPLLSTLSDIADAHGGAGKSSGAGGGDCGIAFMKMEDDVQSLFAAWQHAGIRPLQLGSYPAGVTEVLDA